MSRSTGITSLNIREKVKTSLLKVLEGVGEKDQWKVLIVDENAMQVISSACKVSDLMVKNVTIIESLSKKRQPFPTMDAIYFISPTKSSVDKVIEDFNVPNKPTYQNAHLLFTSRLPETLMEEISRSRLHARVKTLSEVNIDFLAIERPIFTFKQQGDIQKMLDVDNREKEKYANQIADQLYTFFLTAGFAPYVRYASDSVVSKTAASRLYDLIAKSKGLTKDKSIVLIVDRTEDVNTPLLHEFTYQAMTYDLVKVSPLDNIYNYSFTSGDKQQKNKRVLLDEQYDPVWERFRHVHFAEFGKELQKEIDQFLNEHQDISNAQKKEVGKKLEAAEMSDMIRKLPQYQKNLSMYSMHKQVNKDLLTVFREQSLSKIAMEEQNMATGESPEGQKASTKELMTTIGAILSNNSVDDENKMRLIMLFVIFNQGKMDDKKDKLCRMARLSDEQIDTINNLSHLIKSSKGGFSSKVSKFFDSFKKSGGSDKEVGYQLSRYTPKIKELAEKCMIGKLETENYPYINDPPSSFKLSNKDTSKTSSSSSSSSKTASSSSSSRSESTTSDLRSKKTGGPTWNKKKAGSEPEETTISTTSTKIDNSMKMFVFVIGGLTHSEARSCYELMSEHSMDVFFGSTSILTPHTFLEKLSNLRTL